MTPLALLALWGCPEAQDGLTTETVTAVEAATRAAAAIAPGTPDDEIRTVPAEPPGAAAVLPVPLPPGRPILRDCGGMLGLADRPPAGIPAWWVLTATGCGSSRDGAPTPVASTADEASPVDVPVQPNEPVSETMPPPDVAADPAPEAEPEPQPAASRPAPAPSPRRLQKTARAGEGERQNSRPVLEEDRREVVAAPEAPQGGDALDDLEHLEELQQLGYVDDEEDEHQERAKREAPAFGRVENTRGAAAPAYDWGGHVFLSNDDSMSLASAQRVLYGLSHDLALDPREIRRHELLNYFSFDTANPAPGRTFGVLGSAVREGDELSVALAVRGANPPRRPLDLTVVIDRSGSMAAEGKMDFLKRGLRRMVDNLQRGDRIDLVMFDTGVCVPVEGLVVGRDRVETLLQVIDRMRPGGGTDLDAGLRAAYDLHVARDPGDVHGRDQRV
ncbi:MAG: VWA domain-containing protein, partial [Myxococcota bacterium]